MQQGLCRVLMEAGVCLESVEEAAKNLLSLGAVGRHLTQQFERALAHDLDLGVWRLVQVLGERPEHDASLIKESSDDSQDDCTNLVSE